MDAGNGLGAVKRYTEQNFGLPIDDYITIDLEALRDMVDAFDGVAVYVPQDMRDYNPKSGALEGELLQGRHKLMGRECEFFLRYRQGLIRGDLDRLVMRRQFYAGLFRRLKTASVGDIIKLLPVAEYYIRTDISLPDLMNIAIEVSRMDSSGICKTTDFFIILSIVLLSKFRFSGHILEVKIITFPALSRSFMILNTSCCCHSPLFCAPISSKISKSHSRYTALSSHSPGCRL